MAGSGAFNFEAPALAGQLGSITTHRSIAEKYPRFAFQIFDDFADTAAHTTKALLVTTETGTGTSHAIFVPSSSAIQGESTGVAGATSANAQELAGKVVGWKPSTMGPLVMEARVKWQGTTTASDGDGFIGFSDVITATSGLSYDISTSSTVTATGVTEGAMLGYSSIPTSGALHPASGNNYYGYFNTKATTAATPAAVTNSTKKDSNYHIFRVTISTAGDCSFYLDGTLVGYAATAVTATTALTPYINVIGRNSHANTMVVDYLFCGASTRV